ncbi:hypothetical protein [uncultured Brevundimonas sp.]|uniref:hypothetical protein n=1 Tax=uncultured Brevundimonas sp. TaxID=213418 RepID=UPI0030ED2A96|tara:strand:- start:521 stop:1420 length:900 start_codon:yes stop_codon:yes gene_type:complete
MQVDRSGRLFRILFALAVLGPISGCASLRGEPAAISAPANYDDTTVLQHYTSLRDEAARVDYRNEVAYRWIAVSDAEFAAFRHALSREMKGVNLGSDLAVLVMNGAAAVSGAQAARALAVGSATVLGGNATLNREAFLDQSLATALTTAQASRTRRLTEIRRRLVRDTARQYPLGDALIDIRGLNATASINNASAQMAAAAASDLAEANEQAGRVVSIPLAEADVHAVRAAFSAYVVTETDVGKLNQLAGVLSADPDPNLRLYQQNIMDAYAQRVGGDRAAVNLLAPALKMITGRDFKL